MKTMKDFKGTQGDFEIMGNKIQVDPDHPMKTITIAMMYGSMAIEENHANARLFANSKRVLEAAIETANFLYYVQNNSKETETSEFWKELMHLKNKLEQAINDSL